MPNYQFDSIAIVPQIQGRVVFHSDSGAIFKEDGDIAPIIVDERTSYMPWGGDDLVASGSPK